MKKFLSTTFLVTSLVLSLFSTPVHGEKEIPTLDFSVASTEAVDRRPAVMGPAWGVTVEEALPLTY